MEQLTLKKKILLHLLDFVRDKEKIEEGTGSRIEAPTALSQDGISEALGVRQAHVSRALKEMEEGKLLARSKVSVKGAGRMLNVYLLSWEGQKQASAERKRLESVAVRFISRDGEGRKIQLGKLAQSLSGQHSFVQLAGAVSADGVLDIRSLALAAEDKEQLHIDYAGKIVELKYFFGRKKELLDFADWLGSPQSRILMVRGIAGIGKTTLMSKIVNDYSRKIPVFWYRVHEWSSLRNLLEHLSEFLSRLGRRQLASYLSTHELLDIEELMGVLGLGEVQAILIFDDCHKAKDELVQFMSAIKEMMEGTGGAKVVVTGRHSVQFYDRRDVAIKRTVREMELDGLDRESAEAVLKEKGLDPQHWDKIFTLTRGHPLLLEIIKSVEDLESWSDLKKYLQEEIISGLSEREKGILYTACVFRFPFSPRALFSDGETDYDAIDGLVEKSLLQAAGSTYDVHDVIKEFFYRRLTPVQLKSNHATAAAYYLGEKGELAAMEAMHHLIRSGDHKGATEHLIKHGESIIIKGYLTELYSILESFDQAQVADDRLWMWILSHKGDINNIWGEWDRALSKYEAAAAISKKLCDKVKTAEHYRKVGQIHDKRGELDRAMELYNTALKWLGEELDTIEVGRILGSIGQLMLKQGRFDKALEYLGRDLDAARKAGDRRESAQVLHNMGIAHFALGGLDSALKCNTECLELMQEMDDAWGIGTCYTNIANIHMRREDLKSALECNLKSLSVRQQTGDVWGISTCYNNIGNVYYRLRSLDKAIEFYGKSREIFEKLGDARGIIATCNNLGLIWFEKGRMDEARKSYQRCLELVEGCGDERNVASTLGNLGMVYLSMGDGGRALDCYRKSLEIFKKLKDKSCEAVTQTNMGNVFYQSGELKESAECYEKGIELFSAQKNDAGLSAAHHNLGLVRAESGDHKAALAEFEKALRSRERQKDAGGIASTLSAMAVSALRTGASKKAAGIAERALEVAQGAGAPGAEGDARRTLGIILIDQKRLKEAAAEFEKAVGIFKGLKNDAETARTHFEHGRAIKRAKGKDAARHFTAAYQIYNKIGRKAEAKRAKEYLEN